MREKQHPAKEMQSIQIIYLNAHKSIDCTHYTPSQRHTDAIGVRWEVRNNKWKTKKNKKENL
jgi:hypothetical protein